MTTGAKETLYIAVFVMADSESLEALIRVTEDASRNHYGLNDYVLSNLVSQFGSDLDGDYVLATNFTVRVIGAITYPRAVLLPGYIIHSMTGLGTDPVEPFTYAHNRAGIISDLSALFFTGENGCLHRTHGYDTVVVSLYKAYYNTVAHGKERNPRQIRT